MKSRGRYDRHRGVAELRAATLRVLVIVWCLAALACGPEGAVPFELDWTVEGVTYHAHSQDRFACEDVLTPIVQHRRAFARLFETPEVEAITVSYFKYRDQQEYASMSGCPTRSIACFNGNIHSPLPVDHHELIHAWSGWGMRMRAPTLAEGLATALSCDPLPHPLNPTGPVALDVLAPFGFAYQNAGALVTQALREAPTESFMALVREVERLGRNEDALRRALQVIYGLSPEELRTRALQEAAPSCFALGRCEHAPSLRTGSVRMSGGCAGVPALRLDQRLGGAFAIRFAGSPLHVFACSHSAEPYALRDVDLSGEDHDDVEFLVRAPESDHLLTFGGRQVMPEATVTARAATGAFAPDCSLDAKPLELREGKAIRIVVPEQPGVYHVWLRAEAAELGSRWVPRLMAGVSPQVEGCQVCSGGSAAGCHAIDPERMDPFPGGTRLLRLTVDERPPSGLTLELR